MRLLLALICGAIYPLGLAPFDLWPVTLLAIAGLFWLLDGAPRPMLLAWLFGVGKYGVGASWIYVSIHVYGNASPLLAGSLVLLFVVGLALFVLPIGWFWQRYARGASMGIKAGVFIFAWLLMDWVLTWLFTGFPWLYPGYAVMDTWLLGWAPLVGVLGVGAMCLLSAVGGVAAVRLRRPWLAGWALLPWLAGLGLAQISFTTPVETRTVALVQGNIAQSTKWQRDMAVPILETYSRLSAPHWAADILVWPEAAITFYPSQIEPWLGQMDRHARATDTSFVTGIPTARESSPGAYERFNAVIGRGLASGTFAKVHLVPFGEYVPLQGVLRGVIDFFDLPMSSMSAGDRAQPNLQVDGVGLAAAVCYEIAYPDSFRQRARDAGLLATLSNDTWFGGSIGPHQHLQIARMRAVENGRWLLRATNNGITALVDERGRVIERLPQDRAAVLTGQVQIRSQLTPYTWLGDWPVLGLMVIALGVVVVQERRVADG
ncbi:MAG: apolipoprotein N-acyltransferase [Pseudomonadota bacterium]